MRIQYYLNNEIIHLREKAEFTPSVGHVVRFRYGVTYKVVTVEWIEYENSGQQHANVLLANLSAQKHSS